MLLLYGVCITVNIGQWILCFISIVKPTRCAIFEFIEYYSVCFGWSFRSSSGVQDCTHTIRYMSNSLVDCLLAGTRWNCSSIWFPKLNCRSISFPLASSQLTCMTYTLCCVYSLELLTMDGKTIRNVEWYSVNSKNCASTWFYYRNISWCLFPWTSNYVSSAHFEETWDY